MTKTEFLTKAKTWLNHKIILANKSHWYKTKGIKEAIFDVRNNFAEFLNTKGNYSIVQLAILIKRHQNLLETILPIPSNPSYENSLVLLNQLITQAESIISEHSNC